MTVVATVVGGDSIGATTLHHIDAIMKKKRKKEQQQRCDSIEEAETCWETHQNIRSTIIDSGIAPFNN